MAGLKIQDANLVTAVTDEIKVPASNLTGTPVAVSVKQLKDYMVGDLDKEIKENAEVAAAALCDLDSRIKVIDGGHA